MTKYLDENGLSYLWSKLKEVFVAKESGKGLSSNDYTTADRTKLAGIAAGANQYVHPTTTAKTAAFVKVGNDNQGHVALGAAITKADITALGIPAQDTTYPVATNATPGLMSAADKAGLDGLKTTVEALSAAGGEKNQNAFSTLVVGSTNVTADSATDTLTLTAGSNVTLTANAATDQITIAARDTTYSEATTSAAGLLSAADKTKLNGIAAGANNYTLPIASASQLGGVKVDGSTITINSGVISVANGLKFTRVDALPASGDGGAIYLVPNSGGSGNAYDEYVWCQGPAGTLGFEKIGSTEVDLSGYLQTSDVQALSNAEIDAVLAA